MQLQQHPLLLFLVLNHLPSLQQLIQGHHQSNDKAELGNWCSIELADEDNEEQMDVKRFTVVQIQSMFWVFYSDIFHSSTLVLEQSTKCCAFLSKLIHAAVMQHSNILKIPVVMKRKIPILEPMTRKKASSLFTVKNGGC